MKFTLFKKKESKPEPKKIDYILEFYKTQKLLEESIQQNKKANEKIIELETSIKKIEQPKTIIEPTTQTKQTTTIQTPLLQTEDKDLEYIKQKFKDAGLTFNPSLLQNSFVSIPNNNKNDKMFEEFLKILMEFMKDENSFKTGRLDKSGRQNFPASVCETLKKKHYIIAEAKIQNVRQRNIIHQLFMSNFHISNSIQDIKNKQSKAEFYRDMATAFTQYKSWLAVQEAKHMIPEEQEGNPSEKLKRGILGR